MHSLGRKTTTTQTTREVLDKCIVYLKKEYPNFEFKYDKEFFNQQC
jgi:hypothetical protein